MTFFKLDDLILKPPIQEKKIASIIDRFTLFGLFILFPCDMT
jgi:hypothetical protein